MATRIFRFSMLSSLYVAAAAPPGVETRILDEEVEPVDFDTDAELVGLSFMTFNAPRAYEIADRFRLEMGKTVIMGATTRPSGRKRRSAMPTPSVSAKRSRIFRA